MNSETMLARRLLSQQDSALASRFASPGFAMGQVAGYQKESTGYVRVRQPDGSLDYVQLGSNAKLAEGDQVFLSGSTGVGKAANAGGMRL